MIFLFLDPIVRPDPENLMLHSLSFGLDRAPFELLECLSRHSEDIADALDDPTLTAGSVVIATCNRFEVYTEAGPSRGEAVLARVAAAAGLAESTLRDTVRIATGRGTAEHLFAVASGLESAVVGESEIAGQVRRAHDDARDRGTLTHDLEHLFRTATRTSRDVGHRTDIRSTGRSLVRLALRIAEARVPDWQRANVLLIGTGAYAGASIAALRARGAENIHVFSPSGRAAAYAEQHDLRAVPASGLAAALAAADLVVACTRAEEPLLTPEALADHGLAGHGGTVRELLLIDLGMPRNIDPAVAGLQGIELLDLETIAKHAPIPELSSEAEALQIVRDAAEEFAATQAERDALPALLALRTHVLGILEDELCRARKAAAFDAAAPGTAGSSAAGSSLAESGTAAPGVAASEERAAEVEAALRRFTGKLLHTPMTRIRTLGREGRAPDAIDALATLFGLDPLHASHSHDASGTA